MSGERGGAALICAALGDSGIQTVFGVPGTQTVAFYEALRSSALRAVTPTHELSAVFMAQGYFRASSRLAAVSVIPGPGFAFTLAALAEARLDSAAVLLLTGTPPTCAMGRRRSQAIDQSAMAAPVVKGTFNLHEPSQAADVIRAASALACTGEPGPVLVQVAPEVYRMSAADAAATAPPSAPEPIEEEALREAARFCARAGRVVIYAGQGAVDCAAQLALTAARLRAAVATTPSGRGLLPETDRRLMPLDATGDVAAFNAVLAASDAVLVLGAALSETGTFGFSLQFPADRLVRVDASAAVLASPPSARFLVRASCADFLRVLEEELAKPEMGAQGYSPEQLQQMRAEFVDRRSGGPSDARIGGGSAHGFFTALREAIPADGCLVLDSGMHQLLARRHFRALAPRGLIFPTDFQSMAFALPAAIGAKLAQPHRAVVALLGDGGFAMSGQELRTAAQMQLTLPVIVFADGVLGLIRLDQLLAHGHAYATELAPIDYAAFAEALGCRHAMVDVGSIGPAVQAALARTGPTLIVVGVDDSPRLLRLRRRHAIKRAAAAVLGERLLRFLR
jgi:acetolactate synthase-1/2/3 large subunit